MDNVYFEKKIYSKEMMFVTLSAINMAVIGLFNKNALKMFGDQICPSAYKIMCIVVGLSGLHLIFNRDSFLPFLGDNHNVRFGTRIR